MGNKAYEVRDAMVALLSSLSAKSGGVAKTLMAHEGGLDGLTSANKGVVAYPAVLVSYAGSAYEAESAPSFERFLRFSVFHLSFGLEGGAVDLAEDSRTILNGNALGLAITPLIVEREFYKELEGGLTVCAVEYITSSNEEAI